MEEYKPNSHKSKEEQRESDTLPEKKVGKVIVGSAKSKKKGEMQKFADIFISEDVGNVKSYIIMEVLVPAVKKAISDIVTNGIDMILYGETGRTKKSATASKVSYGKFYDRDSGRRKTLIQRRFLTGSITGASEIRSVGAAVTDSRDGRVLIMMTLYLKPVEMLSPFSML